MRCEVSAVDDGKVRRLGKEKTCPRRYREKPEFNRSAPRLEREVGARELKAVQIADYAGGYAAGFEEFAGDLLDLLGGYGFEHGDQLGDREMAVEVHVVAGKVAHAGAGTFEGEQCSTFQVVFGPAKLFGFDRLVAHATKFLED